jgi:predicted CXXCH cytochrome family protein
MKNKKIKKFSFIIFLFMASVNIQGQSITETVHNLSVSGTGTIKASSESEVCIFCHTPHNSSPVSPLWNRNNTGQIYTLYTSSTIQATMGQPDGSSILCLSCHDGTIALGNVVSRSSTIDFSAGITTMPNSNSNLTTDLSDDHPISFLYTTTLASNDGQLKDPTLITWPVELENSKVQCTSCHDPHKNLYTSFLKISSKNSELCLSCHNRNYWTTSSHNTSSAIWNNSGTDPWFHTPYTSVSENACENCHNPHNANGSNRLLKYNIEENNCFDCHNGNVATQNIQAQVNKTYSHNVYNYFQIHDANEEAVVLDQHVECEDCHNPHASKLNITNAPYVQGYNEGVRGINQIGTEIKSSDYEYEICYRCHADSPNKPASITNRQIEQDNVRLEFSLSNPSHHAVVGPGANTDVPSLISPLTESTILYCTDCHSSDGTGAKGPHGSIYPSILKYQYITDDNTIESSNNYALCYSCHDRTSILSDNTFGEHKKHIVDEMTPCNACHDPHGISNSQGTTTNNSHLINFDINIISSSGSGTIKFVDTGTNSGYCMLKCHTKGHGPGMNY